MGSMDATCKLRFLTWTWVPSDGQKTVRPTCIKHRGSEVSIVNFGGGVVILCGVDKHLLANCSQKEFDAEKEQASRQLNAA